MAEGAVESLTGISLELPEKEWIQVLHVDDETGFLKAAKEILEEHGRIEVDTAVSVEEAKEKMKKKMYDAIVCDYIIPRKDGLQFLKELRDTGNNIPFIIFTGKGREDVALEALNLGADGYFSKVGSPEIVYGELAHGIRQAVKTKQAHGVLRAQYESFPVPAYTWRKIGEDFVLVDYNTAAVEITHGNVAHYPGKKASEMYRDRPEILEELWRCFTEKAVIKREMAYEYMSTGETKYLAVTYAFVPPDLVIAYTDDITERKKSEEKYRNLFENARDIIFVGDGKGNVAFVNRAVEEYGFKKEEIVGKNIIKFVPGKYWPELLKNVSKTVRGKPVEGEIEIVTPRGRIFAEYRSNPIMENNKVVGLQTTLRDITTRKKAEREIRESQRKFEGLFRDNPEAAVYVDPDFRILDINPRFTEFFGYSLDEIKGKRLLDVIVPEDKIEEGRMLDKRAQKGYVYQDSTRKRKDGSLVPVSISAAPITVEGQLIGYVGLYKDTSQFKSMERAVRETMMKLAEMNEKLRVVGNLTRHDVRNKLSAVTGNVYLARRKLAGDREVQEHLREVDSAVRQIERIFDFARTYEKIGLEELVDMDVGRAFEEAVSLFSNLQGVQVLNDCRGLTVLADSLLRQLFYNLIHNSLTHGRKVSQIRVYYEEEGKDKLRLVYEDDGAGIPRDEKEKIFRESYGRGTGYGLYLIKKICEVYGWHIQETGKQGEGARFTMNIPKTDLKRQRHDRVCAASLFLD